MTRKQMKRRIEELEDERTDLGNKLRAQYDKVHGLNLYLADLKEDYEETNAKLQRELDFEKLRTEFLSEKVRELLRRQVEHIEDLPDGALD